ncbi:MAG: gamma-glutamyltransferase family protein [Methyloceanibacter sp.]|uniref:gamma-glutamyltransferase family protein n=1 Tax=Methyloceanibacter sp. TaxID=1965321 RepID=UPI003D6DA04E
MKTGKSVVAAGHELTAAAAAEILEDGGNSFDAALAAVCMAFVAEAVFCSPGGGGFLMARRDGSDQVKLFDFFVETPLKRCPASEVSFFPIHADFGPAKQEFHIGLGSSATPGVVPGLFAMHEALGRLPMKRLVEPAVRAARQGFPLTTFQAYLFTVIAPILTASEGVSRIFAPGGKLMVAGETFRNEGFAETLEWIAEDGARLFVDGDVGQAIVAQSRDLGGHLTTDDLRRYRVVLRDPLVWPHAGATVALNPPPAASGALIAFGLAYLEAAGNGSAVDALALHAAMTATNEARGKHGEGLAERLSGGVLFEEMRAAWRNPAAYRGTTHISVIDADGNAAAVSLSNGEGDGFIVGDFGFMLNNMLGEEDLASGGLDAWREGMRLSSMMAPTVILQSDGTVTALGTGGSNRIRTAILQVAVNLLDHGMSLEDAVMAPRLHVERDGTTSFEPELSEEAVTAFNALGEKAHAWPAQNLFFGGVHAARRHGDGGVEGAGDPRRQGVARVI